MSQSNEYIFIRKVHGLNVSREDNLKKKLQSKTSNCIKFNIMKSKI